MFKFWSKKPDNKRNQKSAYPFNRACKEPEVANIVSDTAPHTSPNIGLDSPLTEYPPMRTVYAGPPLSPEPAPSKQTIPQPIEPVFSPPQYPPMVCVYAGPSPDPEPDPPKQPIPQPRQTVFAPPQYPSMGCVYAGPPPAPLHDSVHKMRGCIRLLYPEYHQQWYILRGQTLCIGRNYSQFPIPPEVRSTVSRAHCNIDYAGEYHFLVTDLNSTNGVFRLDRNQRLPAGEKVPITPGTALRIGNMTVMLDIEEYA